MPARVAAQIDRRLTQLGKQVTQMDREIAAPVSSTGQVLAGVAPYNRDSGQWRGKRSVWGGRRQLRAALYLATLVAARHNPVIRDCCQRLLAAGKAPKVALTACMRKLLTICNAIVNPTLPGRLPLPPDPLTIKTVAACAGIQRSKSLTIVPILHNATSGLRLSPE